MKNCSGVMCVIACPMLEDELIYNLIMDPEKKNIYLVDSKPSKSLKEKLNKNSISYSLIDEYSFMNGIDHIDKEEFNIVILMNDLGLHEEPKELKEKLEEQVLFLNGKYDVIAFYYGTCGNAMWDLSKFAAEHNMETSVLIFRDNEDKVCDDCVGVAVGGQKQYIKLLKTYTGMLLTTPAIATNWEDFLMASDMMKGTKGDINMMKWLFELCGYKYAVKIDTGLGDREKYQSSAEDMCREMNLELIDAEGEWTTLEPTKRLYRESKAAIRMRSTS